MKRKRISVKSKHIKIYFYISYFSVIIFAVSLSIFRTSLFSLVIFSTKLYFLLLFVLSTLNFHIIIDIIILSLKYRFFRVYFWNDLLLALLHCRFLLLSVYFRSLCSVLSKIWSSEWTDYKIYSVIQKLWFFQSAVSFDPATAKD